MPLFKRRPPEDREAEPEKAPTRILSQQDILDRLEEEIFRAARYGRALIVLCVRPQRLPGEAPCLEETTQAAESIGGRLRFSDRVGLLDDESLIAVLPETSADVARVIAQKIGADLAIRGATLGHSKWLIGTSSFPDDGADPVAMVEAALKRAQV